jgi:pyruvate-formate lyase-activating enzyme
MAAIFAVRSARTMRSVSGCSIRKQRLLHRKRSWPRPAISRIRGRNIGIAFTYNEPMIGYEFVRDTSRLAKEKDLLTVLVTNGCFSLEALAEVKDSIDAMNIDLKGFTPEYFRYIGGDLEMTKAFIQEANKTSHVELTTLVVPHHNDDLEAFEKECQWISSVNPRCRYISPATSQCITKTKK